MFALQEIDQIVHEMYSYLEWQLQVRPQTSRLTPSPEPLSSAPPSFMLRLIGRFLMSPVVSVLRPVTVHAGNRRVRGHVFARVSAAVW